MANPFLFEDVADYSEPTSGFNPFLCGGDEPPAQENPFLASMSSAPGTNPFADYSWDEPAGNTGLLTPPTITNINDPENDFVVSSDDEVSKPRRPPPPRPSIAKETHDLILSVTGALKATSDDLLERIPPTRAPSPTTFADLHSPSPTPGDFLGGEVSILSVPQTPARPPPPRPPARPQPPTLPPTPAPPRPPPVTQPDVNLFGTPSAPLPKSNDAILNLYSQPKPPPDLMSDDVGFEQPIIPTPIYLGKTATSSSAIDEIPAEPQHTDSVFDQPEPQLNEFKEAHAFVSPKPEPNAQDTGQFHIDSTGFGLMETISEPQKIENTLINDSAMDGLEDKYVPAVIQKAMTVTPPEDRPNQIFGVSPSSTTPQSMFESVSPVEDRSSDSAATTRENSAFSSQAQASELFGVASPLHEALPQLGGELPSQNNVPDIFSDAIASQETTKSAHQVFNNESTVGGIFGVGPPTHEPTGSSIFGVNEPAIEEHQMIRDAPAIQEEGLGMFGVETAAQELPHQIFGVGPPTHEPTSQIFGVDPEPVKVESSPNMFGVGSNISAGGGFTHPSQEVDTFDAFSAKFERVTGSKGDAFDAFGASTATPRQAAADAWGSGGGGVSMDQGFGGDSFDTFLSKQPPPAPSQPSKFGRTESGDSEEGGFNIFIKPREGETYATVPGIGGAVPVLAPPPPKSPGYTDADPRFNPFDKNGQIPALPLSEGFQLPPLSENEPYEGGFKRTDSQETPPTPLFDEDVSQPLEEFPRIHYIGDGWEMQLRHPNKKKITGQRFWKKIFVKLVYQGDNPVLQLFNLKEDKDPFQELPLQACYSVSDISGQQYDQFGKIFTVKLQYIFYKERPGVRPGQVTKAERITTKLSQFAAYAIQGDYQGVKEFGSDLRKLGLPVEHAPQVSQLLKLGCMSYEDLKQFSVTIEECLFRMPVHRDRALTYKMEEVQITVVDEMYVEQDAFGHVDKQIARVRLFFLAFLSGMPDVELGVNDIWRQGKEVVGRHDIVPVVTEEWIRLEGVEFHSCIQLDEYDKTRTIKFKPPDACYIELMRFRIRPPRNRELPLQLKAVMCVTGNKVELRGDVLVPGFTSRKLGQIPCEDVMIRFPIPECWIYLFRVEKHFRYGSVKSAHRRTGKIKGIERFLGAVDNMEPSLMEVTSGQAKYEHQHRAIVWRMPRLPKEGQGAYTTHNLVCRMQLASYDQIPDNLADYAYVEFTMPATTASHTTVRSVSLVDSPSDDPPEKYVRQLARMEYRVGIEHTQGEEMASYLAATVTRPPPAAVPAAEPTPPVHPPAASDSDSSD